MYHPQGMVFNHPQEMVFDHPLPEYYLEVIRSQPMSPQYARPTQTYINPRELDSSCYAEIQHSYEHRRAAPSSGNRHMVQDDASYTRLSSERSNRHHHDDSSSSTTERESSNRVPCEWEGCIATFSRKADVTRHLTSTHKVKLVDCDVNNCSRKGDNGFARKDHLLEHKRGYHSMDLPKRSIKNGKGRHEKPNAPTH